jgi:hypothetical protein
MSTVEPRVTIRPDFLDVNVQAFLFDLAWKATQGMSISAKRWDHGTRLLLVYTVLCSIARSKSKV